MTPRTTPSQCGFCRFPAARLLLEGGLVVVAGMVFALLANQVSPAGLKLTRNYFPKLPQTVSVAPAPTAAPVTPEARLRAKGFQTLSRDEVIRLYAAPEYAADQVIFLDARNEQHYQAGHIPGAFLFDHYRPETCIATVLPACLMATRVVVYCTGGDCEDSEFASVALIGSGVPRERLFIYAGGIADWETARQPVETGARHSGQRLPAKP